MKYNFKIKVRQWFDKKSGCWLIYSKKYDISGYGRTKKRAKIMFDLCIDNILYDSKPKKKI